MSNYLFDVFPVSNGIQYFENDEYVESIDSVWATEEDAKLRLAELAVEKGAEFDGTDTIFYEPPMGSNVDYSEWHIDIWEVKGNG